MAIANAISSIRQLFKSLMTKEVQMDDEQITDVEVLIIGTTLRHCVRTVAAAARRPPRAAMAKRDLCAAVEVLAEWAPFIADISRGRVRHEVTR